VRIQYRTPTQLGLLERFHQTLKTEEVYWKLYTSPGEARHSLEKFRQRYNELRPHWALEPMAGGGRRDPGGRVRAWLRGEAAEMAGVGESGEGEIAGDGSVSTHTHRSSLRGVISLGYSLSDPKREFLPP
jgi:hypothetical protein